MKLFKQLGAALALSTMLVTAATATPDGLEEKRRQAHTFLAQTEDPYVRKADCWQRNWETAWESRQAASGKRIGMMADYVKILAEEGQTEAAAWFLTTGGKYGFAKRDCLPDERESLDAAIRSVAGAIFEQQKRGDNSWLTLSGDFKSQAAATFGYLSQIEKRVDDLQKEVRGLTGEVSHLKILLAKEKEEREKETGSLRDESKSLKALLNQEKEERKAESKSLKALAEKEREERLLSEQNLKAELDRKAKEQADANLAFHQMISKELDSLREKLETNKSNEVSLLKAEFSTTQKWIESLMIQSKQEAKERAEADEKRYKDEQDKADRKAAEAEKRHREEMDRMDAERAARDRLYAEEKKASEKRYRDQERKSAHLMKIITDQLPKSHRSQSVHLLSRQNESSSSLENMLKKSSRSNSKSSKSLSQQIGESVKKRSISSLSLISPKNSNRSEEKGMSQSGSFQELTQKTN